MHIRDHTRTLFLFGNRIPNTSESQSLGASGARSVRNTADQAEWLSVALATRDSSAIVDEVTLADTPNPVNHVPVCSPADVHTRCTYRLWVSVGGPVSPFLTRSSSLRTPPDRHEATNPGKVKPFRSAHADLVVVLYRVSDRQDIAPSRSNASRLEIDTLHPRPPSRLWSSPVDFEDGSRRLPQPPP